MQLLRVGERLDDQLLGLGVGERLERERPDPRGAGEVGDELVQAAADCGLGVAVGTDQPDRRRPLHGKQGGEQIERVRASPVQIVEDEQHAGLAGDGAQARRDGGEQHPPPLLGLDTALDPAAGSIGSLGRRRELRQQELEPASLPKRPRPFGLGQALERRDERARERRVGIEAAPLTAARHDPPAAARSARGSLLEQARLTDPGLAGEQQHRRPEARQVPAKLGQFPLAAGQRTGSSQVPPAAPHPRRFQRGTLVVCQREGGREAIGRGRRQRPLIPLQLADVVGAVTSAAGKLVLCQPGPAAIAPQQLAAGGRRTLRRSSSARLGHGRSLIGGWRAAYGGAGRCEPILSGSLSGSVPGRRARAGACCDGQAVGVFLACLPESDELRVLSASTAEEPVRRGGCAAVRQPERGAHRCGRHTFVVKLRREGTQARCVR
ncbi:MAG TPA: hypothetical protein VFI30_07010 [Nocardioidaceae bacterium]|nr:hypothetical protein [Nocardioidaceae bacterium]